VSVNNTSIRDISKAHPLRLEQSQGVWCLVVVIWIASFASAQLSPLVESSFLYEWPKALQIPFVDWFNALIKGIAKFEVFSDTTVADITRSGVPVIDTITDFLSSMLSGGITSGFGSQEKQVFPPFSWLGVVIVIVLLGYRLGGKKLAWLSLFTLSYLLSFNLWESAAATMSQMFIAVPMALAIGISLGIWLYYSPRIRPTMLLIVDQAQTIPIFSYLVPIVIFFGLGAAPAIVASIIYSAPAIVRAAVLGLEEADKSVGELAVSTGATRRQALWGFLLPTARTALQTGGTQVVLLAFSTGILASLVGAHGLGYDVLVSMRQLTISRGLEAGMAITLLAIMCDYFVRCGFDKSSRQSERLSGKTFVLIVIAILMMTTLASTMIPVLEVYPNSLMVSSGQITDVFVDWFTITMYEPLNFIKAILFINIFRPFETLLLNLPWLPVAITLTTFGLVTGGKGRALAILLLNIFLASSGLWDKSMSTIYLCSIGVFSALLVGMPLGIFSAHSQKASSIVLPVVNILQTIPPFLYLVPAIMMFGTGDFSAFFAIFLFAIVPMVRYTNAGFRSVPESLNEAGRQMGATPLQHFWNIEFPMAKPLLLVGLNQTILLGLSMLVVTALIGTHDLGQEALYGLQKSNPGRAVVAGLAVAAIAIISDRLIGGMAEARMKSILKN